MGLDGRKYNMTDDKLSLDVLKFITVLNRDIIPLAEYGMTAAKIAALGALRTQFAAFPSDDDIQEATTEATAAKGTARTALVEKLRYFGRAIKKSYGEASQRYKNLRISKLTGLPDDQILGICIRLAPKLTDALPDLDDDGLTTAKITQFTTETTAFQTLLDTQEVEHDNRRQMASDRIALGNQIYDLYVVYADDGKQAMKNDPAKYPDYVIYDSNVPSTPPATPENVQYSEAAQKLTWDDVAGETSFTTEITEGATVTEHNVAANVTEFAVAQGAVQKSARVRSRNAAGNSGYSDYVTIMALALAPPGAFGYVAAQGKFTWVLVAGATLYRMEVSFDGGATWNEIFAGDFTVGEYVWTPPSGTHRFRIRSEAGATVSAWAEIEVTVP